jgi:hypothetical protein
VEEEEEEAEEEEEGVEDKHAARVGVIDQKTERSNLLVCVRIRPLNVREKSTAQAEILAVDEANGTIMLQDRRMSDGEPPKIFTFGHVFDVKASQQQVFERAVMPIVDSVLDGYNGTIFCYGQTGAGKTFTMQGIPSMADGEGGLAGLIPRASERIFSTIYARNRSQSTATTTPTTSSTKTVFLVQVSFLEIYNETVHDLLSDYQHGLQLKETPSSGVYVKDLLLLQCRSHAQVISAFGVGTGARAVGATKMNQTSSRSHSISTIIVESQNRQQRAHGASSTVLDDGPIRRGKLDLVDLAGSERQSKMAATNVRLKESIYINLSLSTLGNVVSSLVNKKPHVPYRDSKLTRLLQQALGGNCKAVMIATCSPAASNYEETLSTLRYANRTKSVLNAPKVNHLSPGGSALREMIGEIRKLEAQAAAHGSQGDVEAIMEPMLSVLLGPSVLQTRPDLEERTLQPSASTLQEGPKLGAKESPDIGTADVGAVWPGYGPVPDGGYGTEMGGGGKGEEDIEVASAPILELLKRLAPNKTKKWAGWVEKLEAIGIDSPADIADMTLEDIGGLQDVPLKREIRGHIGGLQIRWRRIRRRREELGENSAMEEMARAEQLKVEISEEISKRAVEDKRRAERHHDEWMMMMRAQGTTDDDEWKANQVDY